MGCRMSRNVCAVCDRSVGSPGKSSWRSASCPGLTGASSPMSMICRVESRVRPGNDRIENALAGGPGRSRQPPFAGRRLHVHSRSSPRPAAGGARPGRGSASELLPSSDRFLEAGWRSSDQSLMPAKSGGRKSACLGEICTGKFSVNPATGAELEQFRAK